VPAEACGRALRGAAPPRHRRGVTTSATGFPRVFHGSHAVAEGLLTPAALLGPSFRRQLPGVYAPADVRQDHVLRAEAVGLSLPTTAQLTGATAATVLGLGWLRWHDRVEVVVPEAGAKHPTGRAVVARRSRSALGPGRPWRTTALAAPERVAFDAAARQPLPLAVARLDALARAGHLDVDRLGAWLVGRRDHGVVRVREALPLVDPRAESLPESQLRVLLRRGGLEVEVQHVVRAGGRFVARVDLAVVAARLAVLYDGAWHGLREQLEKDRRQLNELHAAGWAVVHVTAADLAEPGRALALVRAALAARS